MAYTKLEQIEKKIELELGFCIQFIIDEARTFKDIPIEKKEEDVHPHVYLQVLYDNTHNVDRYKAIGVNDGQLDMIRAIANILGRKDIAQECIQWHYE